MTWHNSQPMVVVDGTAKLETGSLSSVDEYLQVQVVDMPAGTTEAEVGLHQAFALPEECTKNVHDGIRIAIGINEKERRPMRRGDRADADAGSRPEPPGVCPTYHHNVMPWALTP